MLKRFKQFVREDAAATAVEYAVVLLLIVVTALSAIKLVGQQTATTWTNNSTSLQAAGLGSS